MASDRNSLGLLFVGVLAFIVGKAIVSSPPTPPSPSNPTRPPASPPANPPVRPPTDQGPFWPPGFDPKPGAPTLPGQPLKPLPPGLAPVIPDEKPGFNDPFTTATWSTSDQPAVGGNPGSEVVMEYDDPWIRNPYGYGETVLGAVVIDPVAGQAPAPPAQPGDPLEPGEPGLDPGLDPGLNPGLDPGGMKGAEGAEPGMGMKGPDPGMIAGDPGGALQP